MVDWVLDLTIKLDVSNCHTRDNQGRTKSGRGRVVPKLGRGSRAAQAAGGVQGPRPGVAGGFCPPEDEKISI